MPWPIGLWGLWALTAGAGIWDLRTRTVPNTWWALGAAWIVAGWCLGWWPWTHVIPLVAVALLYELANALQPGQFGYGDVKWALLIMGAIGWPGLWLLALAHVLTIPVGTATWLRGRRQTAWNAQHVPWVTVLWVGWTLSGVALWALVG